MEGKGKKKESEKGDNKERKGRLRETGKEAKDKGKVKGRGGSGRRM